MPKPPSDPGAQFARFWPHDANLRSMLQPARRIGGAANHQARYSTHGRFIGRSPDCRARERVGIDAAYDRVYKKVYNQLGARRRAADDVGDGEFLAIARITRIR